MTVRFESDSGVFGTPGSVLPRDIRFDPSNSAHCTRLPDGSIFLRIVCEPGLEEALVVVSADSVTGHAMEKRHEGGRFVVWECAISDPPDLLRFSFAFLADGVEPVYLAPSGITNAIERLDRFELDTGALAVHEVPSWAVGTSVYQIFPDRFATMNPDASGSAPWGSEPNSDDRQGGDLAGITSRAGYIQDLGVGAVYLNPIFTSPSNHRYDTIDYMSVDPSLGGIGALDALITDLHQREIRVILDASFNHCHPRFFAFDDVMRHGADSPYAGWFDVSDHPARIVHRPSSRPVSGFERHTVERLDALVAETGLDVEIREDDGPAIETTYDAWYGVPTMPRIDVADPGAREYMLGVATHWVKQHHIDGWRMDVARYVDTDFWIDLRRAVKAVRPDAILIAEIMGDAGRWLQGDRFDSVMNYTFRQLCHDLFGEGTIDVGRFLDGFIQLMAMYSPIVSLVNFNLISSHDTPRFLTVAGGDDRRLHLAKLFQLTTPGMPSIYYGDERGMAGADDPLNRGAFPTHDPAPSDPTWRTTRELVHLRRSSAALRRGRWFETHRRQEGFTYRMVDGAETVGVAINVSNEPVSLPMGPTTGARKLWGPGEIASTGGEAVVERLPALSGCVVAL